MYVCVITYYVRLGASHRQPSTAHHGSIVAQSLVTGLPGLPYPSGDGRHGSASCAASPPGGAADSGGVTGHSAGTTSQKPPRCGMMWDFWGESSSKFQFPYYIPKPLKIPLFAVCFHFFVANPNTDAKNPSKTLFLTMF